MTNQNNQVDWKKELNKRFFYGIPMEEMGSNQVSEETLQNFIEQTIQQETERKENDLKHRILQYSAHIPKGILSRILAIFEQPTNNTKEE